MPNFQKGHIFTRRTKKYGLVHVIVYRARQADGTWKQNFEAVHTRYRKEVEKVLAERLGEINGGNYTEPTTLTFSAFVAQIWEPHAAELKPSTRKAHASNVRHHLIPSLGGLKLKEIQPMHLSRLLEQKRAAGMSDKSRLNLYLLLSAMFSYAVSQRLLQTSPLSPQDRPRVERQEKPTLTPAQIAAIISNIALPMRALFVTLALTGLRIGEVLGLKWRDLDFENGILHIRRSVWMGQEQSPKSKASIRPKLLGAGLRHALETHRLLSHYTQPDDYVFANGAGHAINPDDLRKRVLYPAMDAAKINRSARAFGFHIFRHSAGTEFQQATGNLKATSTFLHRNYRRRLRSRHNRSRACRHAKTGERDVPCWHAGVNAAVVSRQLNSLMFQAARHSSGGLFPCA